MDFMKQYISTGHLLFTISFVYFIIFQLGKCFHIFVLEYIKLRIHPGSHSFSHDSYFMTIGEDWQCSWTSHCL